MFKKSDIAWGIIILLSLVWMVWSYAKGAPAPLPRKEAPHNPHPAWMYGDHILKWYSADYRVEMKADGTFVIPYSADSNTAEYKGVWGLSRDGELSYMEWSAASYDTGVPCSFKYTFTQTAYGWRGVGCVHSIRRPGIPRPTD